MRVIHCNEQQLDTLATLFNDYRLFYEQQTDIASCRAFIQQNLTQARSVIFLLLGDDDMPVGFAQLYPAICSLSMRPYYYLSDLYVAQSARRQGYARYLMNYISKYAASQGAQRLTLDTAISNTVAQGLYESLGYEREEVYITYHQLLTSPE